MDDVLMRLGPRLHPGQLRSTFARATTTATNRRRRRGEVGQTLRSGTADLARTTTGVGQTLRSGTADPARTTTGVGQTLRSGTADSPPYSAHYGPAHNDQQDVEGSNLSSVLSYSSDTMCHTWHVVTSIQKSRPPLIVASFFSFEGLPILLV